MREWLSGRASACQGECRGFESRFPLQHLHCLYFITLVERRYSQVVRPRSAKPLSPGSNPGGASKKLCACNERRVFFLLLLVFIEQNFIFIRSCGGIGRRKGLKSICVENHSQFCEFLTKNLTFTRRPSHTLEYSVKNMRRCGGIGRRKGLKIPRSRDRAGSSPASGTRIWGKIFGFYPIFLPLGKNWGKKIAFFCRF